MPAPDDSAPPAVPTPDPSAIPPSEPTGTDSSPDAEPRPSGLLTPTLTPPPAVPGALVVRHPRPEEEPWRRAAVISTYGSPFAPRAEEQVARDDDLIPFENRLVVAECAADGTQRLLGGAGRHDSALSLPGGGRVPVAGLIGVGVASGEQHRGAFRALVEAHLDECRERGDAASVLMASLTPLYGRFGYGCATQAATWQIDAPVARALRPGAPTSGRVTLEHGRGEALNRLLHDVWEAAGTLRAGSLTRSPGWWDGVLGSERGWVGGGPLLVGLHWTPAGDCDGFVLYDVDLRHGRDPLAESEVTIRELVAVDVAAELDLWRFVADLPWVRQIEWAYGPVDPAPLFWLADTRALRRMWQADFLWLRPLDLAALTRHRTFAGDGVVSMQVGDPRYPDLAGRFDLVVTDGVGAWVTGSGPAQLTLSVADLGALWLGDVSALRVLGAGRIWGDAGAAHLLDTMLAVPAAPRCMARF